MKTAFLLLIFGLFIGCASQEDRWATSPFEASQINSVALPTNMSTEEYNLSSCSKSRSIGEIRLSDNSTHYFCIAKGNETKFATIKKLESKVEICLWKESGFCADGVCESMYSASDCKTF